MRRISIAIAVALTFFGGYAWTHTHGDSTRQDHKAPTRKVLYWVDPMHPSYKSDKPGTAPDCGMVLEPVYAEEAPEQMPASRGAVHVSSDMQQMIGVQYGAVTFSTAAQTIRAPGRVVPDETRVTRVYPHMEGWIARTFVDFNGQVVKKGEPLLTIYSPEVLASEQELLLALNARDRLKGSPMKDARANSELLVQATRRRLEVFDLTTSQIAQIEQMRAPLAGATVRELFERNGAPAGGDGHTPGLIQSISVFSPASGYVMARNAYPSQHVTLDTELYAISDLSRVWIVADVFESDMGCIHEGQSAVVTLPGNEPSSLRAIVSYVQPQVDPQTRTAKVRLEVANDQLRLKPDMFVDVQFLVRASRRLMVPSDAVIDTGTKQTVYVDCGNGYLEPRAVRTGERMGDEVEILAGLKAGERIVTSGTFLIDSESHMRSSMTGPGRAADRSYD